MIDNSLKHELEAEVQADIKRKRLAVITCILVSVIGITSVAAWAQSQPNNQKQSDVSARANQPTSQPKSQPVADTTNKPNESTLDKAGASATINQTQSAKSQTYTPSPQVIDKVAFTASGQAIVSNYDQIVGLVTFSSSMSDDEKSNRIKQAVTLDQQYFGKTTDLRGQLVIANVSSGLYVDATELAESGVSKISVGLTYMNYWADNRSRTSDLQSGLGNVAQGANILLGFSSKLGQL